MGWCLGCGNCSKIYGWVEERVQTKAFMENEIGGCCTEPTSQIFNHINRKERKKTDPTELAY